MYKCIICNDIRTYCRRPCGKSALLFYYFIFPPCIRTYVCVTDESGEGSRDPSRESSRERSKRRRIKYKGHNEQVRSYLCCIENIVLW